MKKYLHSDESWIIVNDAAASIVSRVSMWLDRLNFYSSIVSLALASIQPIRLLKNLIIIRNWIWQVKNTFYLWRSWWASYCEQGLNQLRGLPYTLHKSNMIRLGTRRLKIYNMDQKISVFALLVLCWFLNDVTQHNTCSPCIIMNRGFKCTSACVYLLSHCQIGFGFQIWVQRVRQENHAEWSRQKFITKCNTLYFTLVVHIQSLPVREFGGMEADTTPSLNILAQRHLMHTCTM